MDSSSVNSAQLQNMMEQEQQKVMLNEMASKVTSVCWDRCITSAPGNKFSSGEHACLSNCAHRYMDMCQLLIKKFQSMSKICKKKAEEGTLMEKTQNQKSKHPEAHF